MVIRGADWIVPTRHRLADVLGWSQIEDLTILIEQIRGKANVGVQLRSEVRAVYGTDHLTGVDILNHEQGTLRRADSDAVFVFIGADAETSWLPDGIARDARNYVLTEEDVVRAGRWHGDRDPYLLETSAPEIFACGDVRSGPVSAWPQLWEKAAW